MDGARISSLEAVDGALLDTLNARMVIVAALLLWLRAVACGCRNQDQPTPVIPVLYRATSPRTNVRAEELIMVNKTESRWLQPLNKRQ